MTRTFILGCLLLAGCATAGRRPAPSQERIGDSVSERMADQRAVDPNLHAEDDARRWGVAEAQQGKAERARKARQKSEAGKGADVKKNKNEGAR